MTTTHESTNGLSPSAQLKAEFKQKLQLAIANMSEAVQHIQNSMGLYEAALEIKSQIENDPTRQAAQYFSGLNLDDIPEESRAHFLAAAQVLKASVDLVAIEVDEELRQEMQSALNEFGMHATQLIATAKSLVVQPSGSF